MMSIEVTYLDGSKERFSTEESEALDRGLYLDGAFVEDTGFSIMIPWTAIRKVERLS